jgi:hypothetical protein
MIRSSWFRLLRFFAANRTAVVAVLSPFPVLFINLGLNYRWWFLALSLLTYVLLVTAATAPSHYARLLLLEMMLQAIHKVLELDLTARITIHHIRSRSRQYEQLTNYFPLGDGGQGRRFDLGKGIVGRCFTSRAPRMTSLEEGQLKQVYQDDWGYTASEAARVRQDRRSFFAFPIGEHRDCARAVIYMDSADAKMFRSENENAVVARMRALFLPALEELLK